MYPDPDETPASSILARRMRDRWCWWDWPRPAGDHSPTDAEASSQLT